MDNEKNPHEPVHSRQRLHPLMATAAVAVILCCGIAVAAMTGWLPLSNGAPEPAPFAQTPPAAMAAQPRIAEVADRRIPEPRREPEPAAAPKPVYRPAAPPPCHGCGHVDSIQPVTTQGQTNGLGVAAGAVVGGILGHQVGSGRGNTLATLAGAVGGGYAGNEVEKNRRQSTTYRVYVRMDDGSTRYFTEPNPSAWHPGQRVRDAGGSLEPVF